jgi:hypothetical protein
MIEYCICGHTKSEHDDLHYVNPFEAYGGRCWECYYESKGRKGIHAFGLDNLKLIEDLAKEKHLI